MAEFLHGEAEIYPFIPVQRKSESQENANTWANSPRAPGPGIERSEPIVAPHAIVARLPAALPTAVASPSLPPSPPVLCSSPHPRFKIGHRRLLGGSVAEFLGNPG